MESRDYHGPTIMKATGLSDSSLHRRLRLHGLSLRPKYQYRTTERWLEVIAPYRTMRDAAEGIGMSHTKLSKLLTRAGVEHGFTTFKDRRRLELVDTEALLEIFKSNDEIVWRASKVLGCNCTTLKNEMTRRGIHVETQRYPPRHALRSMTKEELVKTYDAYGWKGFHVLGCHKSTYFRELRRRGIR